MDPRAHQTPMTVSNLVPVWDEPELVTEPVRDPEPFDGGGSFAPAEAATVVAQVLRTEPAPETRLVTPPERYDPTDFVERQSSFSYDLLDDRDDTWAERTGIAAPAEAAAPVEDVPAPMPAGIVHERRSAYEIAFILLAAAVAVLLAAPPLVQVLLAARGIQA